MIAEVGTTLRADLVVDRRIFQLVVPTNRASVGVRHALFHYQERSNQSAGSLGGRMVVGMFPMRTS